ncbi:hypothetical protein [Oceanobacillus jeddahense]|uniref:hypothetical protein n=1 Tax=Oceanobacillus jeddahense TaxID=1462527 RepID=UPI0005958C22|nr:hypothetical protein [Oceanobacillus jeddahense]
MKEREIDNLLDEFDEILNSEEYTDSHESPYMKVNSRTVNEYDTNLQFKEHSDKIRKHILDELKAKQTLRKYSYWIIIGIFVSLMILTWTFLFRFSEDTPLALLMTVTIAAFGNMLSLVAIIFKYVFSSTTEITDYAKILLDNENNGR